jgi:hypothetical protein
MVEDYEEFPVGKERGEENMRKSQRIGICMLLMVVGLMTVGGTTAVALKNTTLFVTVDSAWEHAHEGDAFVVRADVKNIGNYPALVTRIRLKNIPDNWDVRPNHQFILLLMPGQTKPRFFVIERGASDATIYATAQAYNAPVVQSNRIAIPISAYIVVGLTLVCGTLFYREVKTRKKQEK